MEPDVVELRGEFLSHVRLTGCFLGILPNHGRPLEMTGPSEDVPLPFDRPLRRDLEPRPMAFDVAVDSRPLDEEIIAQLEAERADVFPPDLDGPFEDPPVPRADDRVDRLDPRAEPEAMDECDGHPLLVGDVNGSAFLPDLDEALAPRRIFRVRDHRDHI